MRRIRRQLGGLAGPVLFVLAVVALSAVFVAWQAHRRQSALVAAPAPKRFSGARTVSTMSSRLPPATLGEAIAVAIVHDTASDKYYDAPAAMDSVLGRWSEALQAIGARVQVESPAEALRDTRAQVLVVPASPCLGRDSRHALQLATERGQGVLLTWLTGIRDGGCKQVGYGLLTRLTGASRLDTLDEHRDGDYVTFLRGGPLAADIPPGSRIELVMANHVAVRAPTREAYFSDYMLNPSVVRGQPLLDGAVSHTRIGRSRVVYWGFDLLRVVPVPWNEDVVLRLVRNSVAWAAGAPLATLHAWPYAKAAAVVLAQDVEDQFPNGRYALDSLRAAHVPGTFFVVSELAQKYPELTRAMAQEGEVGTHTPRHQLLGGEPDSIQAAALETTQHELRDLVGHPVPGLRPPEEQFDDATLVEWAKAGGRYVFGANNGRSASPEIVSVRGHSLVLMGRVNNDDFMSVKKAGITDPSALARDYIAALAKVKALGGLYLLSYHSQMLSRPELVPALATVARHVAADSTLWVTTAGQVADWWIERGLVDVSARFEDPRTLIVEAHNRGHTTVKGAAARVAIGRATVRQVEDGGRLLPSDEEDALSVLLPDLPPGSTRTVRVLLDAPPRGEHYAN